MRGRAAGWMPLAVGALLGWQAPSTTLAREARAEGPSLRALRGGLGAAQEGNGERRGARQEQTESFLDRAFDNNLRHDPSTGYDAMAYIDASFQPPDSGPLRAPPSGRVAVPRPAPPPVLQPEEPDASAIRPSPAGGVAASVRAAAEAVVRYIRGAVGRRVLIPSADAPR